MFLANKPYVALATSVVVILYIAFMMIIVHDMNTYREPSSSSTSSSSTSTLDIFNTKAVALPSVRVSSEEESESGTSSRGIYGGKGDKAHLGGFTKLDENGISPNAWRAIMELIGVKSIVDVGCGKGVSTSFFELQGLDATCIEGSHDGVSQTLLKNTHKVIEHDYTRGPYWTDDTVDAVWIMSVLEHIGRNYHANLFPTFQKAALVFGTFTNFGGWHHVEIHDEPWWITRFSFYGFIYSDYLTKIVRSHALCHKKCVKDFPNSEYATCRAQYIQLNVMVFVNPRVASLPKHAHLMSEFGCGKTRRGEVGRECGTANKRDEEVLPPQFKAIPFNYTSFSEWEEKIFNATNTSCKKE